jgi:hypothetical protein
MPWLYRHLAIPRDTVRPRDSAWKTGGPPDGGSGHHRLWSDERRTMCLPQWVADGCVPPAVTLDGGAKLPKDVDHELLTLKTTP